MLNEVNKSAETMRDLPVGTNPADEALAVPLIAYLTGPPSALIKTEVGLSGKVTECSPKVANL